MSTVAELQAAPGDTWCKDATGDRWLKTNEDRWTFNDETFLTSYALDRVWGPIEIKGQL